MEPTTLEILVESLIYSVVRFVGIGGGIALIVTAGLVLHRAWCEREWHRLND